MSKTEAISEPSKLQSAELGTPEDEGAEPRGGSVDLKHVPTGAHHPSYCSLNEPGQRDAACSGALRGHGFGDEGPRTAGKLAGR